VGRELRILMEIEIESVRIGIDFFNLSVVRILS
jgi:hypothetical protein